MTISGTHGVEGYCGSGAQLDWMLRGEQARVPAGTAVMIIHAINPYGFAWNRRVTHANVDLNRNWIDFDGAARHNRAYDELAEAVTPREWDERAQAESTARILDHARQHGPAAMQQAVNSGQYRHPAELFYGGSAPTWSRRTPTEIFISMLGRARQIAIIDCHTGPGPWG